MKRNIMEVACEDFQQHRSTIVQASLGLLQLPFQNTDPRYKDTGGRPGGCAGARELLATRSTLTRLGLHWMWKSDAPIPPTPNFKR